jgi:RNA polymerase sigma-70 factor (ECF subfamily)
VYAYVRLRLTLRTDLVDDVVQDVFVAALKGLAAFRGQSSLRTWMIGIARHKIEDVYRQRLRRLDETEMDAAEGDPALAAPAALDDLVDLQRRSEKTHRVLARLPEQYGLLLLWRYWEQRSTRDMAVALGTTEKSVERSLARARARFQDLWLREP